VKLKLIKVLRTLLENNKYNIAKIENRIMIYWEDNSSYPEDYIEISQNNNSLYNVLEVHRNDKKNIVENVDEKVAISIAVIICNRLFQPTSNDISITRKLRQLVESGDIVLADNLLKQHLEDSVYLLELEDINRVSLIVNKDKADVKFHGRTIVKNAKLSRGYVVLYNYAKHLMEFNSIYVQIKKVVGYTAKKVYMENIYLFGE